MINFVSASFKNIHGKPFCFSMLARSIRGSNVQKVIGQLGFKKGKYCDTMRKLLSSALSNANDKGIEGSLTINEILVGRGKYLKRIEFKGRGRVGSKWRAHTNLRVILKAEGVNGK